MYFHTSIFISRRDTRDSVTHHQKFSISENSVFKPKNLFPKIDQNHPKTNRGSAQLTLTQVGAKCVSTVMPDNQDRALHQ